MSATPLVAAFALVIFPEGSRLRAIFLRHLAENPGLRDFVQGFGSAVDPAPVCYRQTFITDDQIAMAEDWMFVGESMREAFAKAEESIADRAVGSTGSKKRS